jgi:hypothetical protein
MNNERVPYVPNKIPPGERAAEIVHIKALAEDLASDKANYAATLESIVVRARRLFDDEARLIGRGYKDGENQACRSCDGIYVNDDGALLIDTLRRIAAGDPNNSQFAVLAIAEARAALSIDK